MQRVGLPAITDDRKMTKPLIAVFLLSSCVFFCGCADRPEVDPVTFGRVVEQLPILAEAEKPFVFPYAGDNDHRSCVFNEEDFF